MARTKSSSPNEPIAIIGSGCRFPGGASSPSKLWDLLRDPRDVLSEIPPSRWDVHGFHHPDSQFPGHANVKHSYLLEDDVAQFDAQFFNLTPAEAVAMDPQQRLLLETVYEGLESAGLTIEELRGSDTGVYVGVMYVDYEALQFRDLQHIPTYLAIGTARSIVSNRVSYFFDWHGPSLTVDTACSSSLVALHQAMQALRSGEVKVALAAGTNLLLGPEPYIHESKLKMLSPDGRSRMWDQDANGYARGDGVASVVLKTLSAALADGDNIECIIRETGVNQDGRSRGITMPSATAQATLIRDTYARAGLDPTSATDRCQYFEAHGTGTPAGDPVEAEAIHTAFFGDDCPIEDESPLYVGSIKTIIGHTESTAGLAGVLKVVQAMKHGYIPPNMLLNRLNPNILPFYNHLHIPQELTPWPQVPGQPRRASVNSFGFGGTNGHVILESFEPLQIDSPRANLTPFTPFVFSAQSKQSLLASLNAHTKYLEDHPNTSPTDLAWTLRSRRSRLPLRVSFPASSIEVLRSNLKDLTNNFQLDTRSATSGTKKTRILGVFTGQGAQWARMGAEFIETSEYAANILGELDDVLAQLPELDRPSWTLQEELLAEGSSSNVNNASISQPICTAVQIILVKLLTLAGIEFAAVVGHSSGEIAAAFAAGYLSAHDAIRIAYYRGLHSHLAGGPNGVQGAMLAVGTTLEDAEELCNDVEFKGRVNVAACNSPSSLTLSGDEDAIAEMSYIFEDENKFFRRLRVDKAYHSHHMIPCSQAYLDSMSAVSIKPERTDSSCVWVSSVNPDRPMNEVVSLEASYWVDNLLSPVLFTQAVERALSFGPFDGAIEVGPHPALKGPVRDTLQNFHVDIPYTGLLQRNSDSIQSVSTALGYLWSHMDNLSIDFDRYEGALGGLTSYRFVSDLPVYQWNHSQGYWHESNLSRKLRQRSHPVHPLLGDMSPQSSPHQLMWKTILRPQDLPWVHDHRIQGQTVFPAAGYVSTALETVPFLAPETPVQLVELEDFVIHQAMVFGNDEESGIEVRSTVSNINQDDPSRITAHFTYEALSGKQQDFHLVASGEISISIGQPSPQILPATGGNEPNMVDVPADILYESLKDIGYGYTGPFQALSDMKRKLGLASGSIAMTASEFNGEVLAVHPGVLDAAFHSIIMAFSYPRDGQLWSLHLPTSIERIRINPSLCGRNWVDVSNVPFVASLDVHGAKGGSGFQGDVEIQDITGDYTAVQVEGLRVVPFTPATAADDQNLFYSLHWVDAEPNADIPGTYLATVEEKELAVILERGCLFYLRQLEHQIPHDHPGRSDKYNAAYLNFASHNHKLCLEGRHRYAKKEWLNDTLEDILAITERFSDRPEVKAMHVVGEQMPRAIRGETAMLEHLMMNGLLSDYYTRALSMAQGTDVLAATVLQIARRYPHGRILEVGAGTGGATRQILKRIGQQFSSYAFTDISAGFFGTAQTEFAAYEDRMTYNTLDLERDLQTQGFEKHSYDVVVASFVLHATKSLEQTVRRVRTLLKPGGYLILYEVTNVDLMRGTALFGCLPGWWEGVEEGRTLGAAVTEAKWDAILRKSGFSGIDTTTVVQDSLALPNSVLVSQAVDDWVEFMREPLVWRPSVQSVIKHLFIVGGTTFRVSRLIEDLLKLIRGFCEVMTRVETFEELNHSTIDSKATVLVLADLDEPVFKDITEARFDSVKKLFGSEKTILWVTKDRMVNNPFGCMPVGFARSALWEVPELRYQFVDFEGVHRIDARVLTETVLRFQSSGSIREQSKRNALWPVESEIIINSDGRQLVPRLVHVSDANDRYNSARRTITKDIQPQNSPVVISNVDGQYVLHEKAMPASGKPNASATNTITVKVSHSSLQAVKSVLGDAFVVLGTCSKKGTQYIGLADSASSLVEMPQSSLVPCSVAPQSEGLFLNLVTANLLLPVLTASLADKDTLVVHNAPQLMANSLVRYADTAGIRLTLTTSSKAEAEQKNWVHVSQYARQSELKSLLPSHVSRCIDLTPLNRQPTQPSPISLCLPSNTHIINALSVFPSLPTPVSSRKDASEVSKMVQLAMNSALEDLGSWQQDSLVSNQINIRDLAEKGDFCDGFTVAEWNAESLPITVQPVKTQFHSNRSYWLVGLSRDMGLSIADWMIRNGAKYLVITSRNPKVDKAWLDSVERRGAVVRIMSNDLIDYESVRETYREICATLPPVAGVAQGAMLLKDVATRDMKLEELTRVTRPKVEGSLNLDNILQDVELDFFIFFSSVATVAGNPGQANYTTANLFMSGLASQRRRRGLAASVIELGLIMGTGYITRERGDVLTKPSFDRGLLTISETDVHQTFAEAVNASHPDSGEDWQISAGLRQIPANAPNRPQWYSYPQFACLTVRDTAEESNTSSTQAGPSIKDQLAKAATSDEIGAVISGAFITELRKMLHLSDDYDITPSVRTDELGLDSLVAVRIRSWFLNNFQVNIPALKILKGTSLQDLIEQAAQEIPIELTPKMSPEQCLELEVEEESQSSSDSAAELPDTPPSSDPQTEDSSSSIQDDLDIQEQTEALTKDEVSLRRFGPLSYTQSVFLFVHELLNDKTTLNNTVMLHLKGEIRIPDLAQAIRTLGERHEALRTCICERDGQLIQGILESPPLTLEHKSVYNQEEVSREYASLRKYVFDLASGRTSRIILLSASSRDHYLMMGSHHIIFDRSSTDTFMFDLERTYDGQQPEVYPLQYLDYSNEQHEQYSSGSWRKPIEFWQHEFTTIPDPLPLHWSRVSERRPLERYKCRIPDYRISKQLAGQIRQVARKHRSTTFHFHLAAFKVLLHRFLGVKDVCIGIADSCRRDDYMHTGIGPFLNMLPVRMNATGEQRFSDAMEEARQKSFSVLANSVPLEVILNELRVSRQSTHAPLAQAFMNYAESDIEDGQSFLGCQMEVMSQDQAELPYDFTFTIINNTSGDTRIILNVQASLYSEDDALLIAHGYEDILREFANTPDNSIGDEWKFRQSVLDKALIVGRGHTFNSTWPETLAHRFDQLFPSIAQRLAVKDGDNAFITYGELSRQIDIIASELLRKGTEPGSRVAIFQHPTVHWVASVVAILKIGAVYVPLDAGTPVARLSLIVTDCQPAAILVHGPTLGMTAGLDAPPSTTIIDVSTISELPNETVPILAKGDSPAIILYTSGSTGTPKGVVLQHASLKHEFDHCAATYGLGQYDVVLQQSAWSFDISVTQIFLALGVGARLQMVSHLVRADSQAMAELIKHEGVTATYATPTEYKSWLRREHQEPLRTSSWRLALVAGEPVTEPLLQLFRELNRPSLRLFNVYGPTETTCGSTKTELMYGAPGFYEGTIPVGRASANECFYILDGKQNLQPCGQAGEIAIGGVGVAMGYLNNDERTRASFLLDTFADEEYVQHGWTTMYRTGDVGYLQQDGTLILKGRIGGDTEIKLNGVRIDLTDVEQTILNAANGVLADAVGTLRSTFDEAVKFMVVHVVFSSENLTIGDKNSLLQQLLGNLPLPRTMRPSAIIPIDELPRTVTGKVDRRAIASLSIPQQLCHETDGPALSKAESTLRSLWESVIPGELVSIHQIDADSDFFSIGGSSMLLIELQHKLKEQLGISVPLLNLFQANTLRSMARILDMEDEAEINNDRIDWDAETALQDELERPSLSEISNPISTPPRVIILTGATGFIGQYLVRALADQEHVEKVICIANRNLNSDRRALFFELEKVECYEGDLTLPRLGLSDEAASQIFGKADSVIHNGADVSHLKTYSSLRSANLASTQELVKLCLPRNIPLHYVSTTGVTMYTTSETFGEVSVQNYTPPTNGLYGYTASKWASEIYLERVNAEYNLPIYIHRPSSVIRPEPDMLGDNPAADVLQNMLAYSQRVLAVPMAPGLRGTVDLVHPTTVTNKVTQAVMGHNHESESNGVTYIHESGDLEIGITEFKEYLMEKTGSAVIDQVSLDKWILRAEKIGLSASMAAVFKGLGNAEGSMNFPRLLRN
ncbi:hypothetical protein MW887_003392 [Aspergillus wentii]|nr:hypothetical protein MW887_003392 [Aspergillus wentii]